MTLDPLDAVMHNLRISFIQRAMLTHRGQTRELFLIDLGLRGVFVEHDHPLAVGESVEIVFRLPGNEIPIAARCRVAWWHPPEVDLVSKMLPAGLGLEFLELPEADLRRIREQLVEHYHRDPRTRQFARQWPDADEDGALP